MAKDIAMTDTARVATASTLELDYQLLGNNGLQIETREGMGRVAVAKKSFDIMYDKVIREKPSLVWEADNMLDYVQKYKEADAKTQTAILDMYHPPLYASSVAMLKRTAATLAKMGVDSDVNFIHKLLAILATNAHQYYGENIIADHGDLRQYEQLGGTATAKRSALFVYGSKIAHSCAPNLAYTSKTDDGALEYKVIRPIQQGEVAAFSYLEQLYQTPSNKRREQLMETKSFWCECSRCMAPDYCRCIRCTGCKTSFIPCVYTDEGKPTWTCTQCGLRNDIEQKENKLVFRLQALEVRAAEQPLKPLEDLVKDSTEHLSPVHYITIEALETVAQLSASKAANQERMQMFMGRMRGGQRGNIYGAPSTYFRKLAAETGLKAVVACECVAADCLGCYESSLLNDDQSFPHEPVYELGSKVFHACTDLMEVPEPKRPTFAAALVQRYLPVMRGLFGGTDNDVQLIEDKIVNVSSSLLSCRKSSSGRETEDSSTKPNSTIGGATKASVPPPKNKSHQKPRRSTKKKKGNRSGRK